MCRRRKLCGPKFQWNILILRMKQLRNREIARQSVPALIDLQEGFNEKACSVNSSERKRRFLATLVSAPSPSGGGGYSSEFLVGVCRPDPQILTQFQVKIFRLTRCPFSDLVSEIHTRFRDRAGGGAGGRLYPPPPTFVLYKIKIKESSNEIAEEISLVRNGVKLHFNISKSRRRHSRQKE